jgi:hypothetical protein
MRECGNGGMREWGNGGMREWGNAGMAKERFKYVLKGKPLYCNDLDESVGIHGFFINNQYYN